MASLKKINIDISGFRLLTINGNETDLTTAHRYENFHPENGGIRIIPELLFDKREKGCLLIRQICTFHQLNIITNNNNIANFLINSIHKDTIFKTDLNYKRFILKDGKTFDEFGIIEQKPIFWDSLNQELFPSWKELEYKIKFKTFYIHSTADQKSLNLIFSIEWMASATCKKGKNIWELSHSRISTEEEVLNSINLSDILPDFKSLPHLKSAVETHFNENKEILKK